MNARAPLPRPPRRRTPRVLRGQSIVEYALTVALIFIVARGTLTSIFEGFVSIVETVRNGIEGDNNAALPPGSGPPPATPTPRLPPAAPTLTPLPNSGPSSDPRLCYVPNLVGISFENARDIVWAREGFSTANLTKPNGTNNRMVIGQQSIAAGSMVDCSTSMLVQTKTCTVPNMVNQRWNDAYTAWTGAGFMGADLTNPQGSSTTFIVGTQSVAAGTVVNGCDRDVLLTPKQCMVPNLVGLTFNISQSSNAHSAWSTVGFSAAQLRTSESTLSTFTVGYQSRTAATWADCEATMNVEPRICTVPNMVGMNYSAALASWSGNNFVAANLIRPAGVAAGLDFTITEQNVAANTQADCTATQVVVSPPMCTMPSLVGLTMNTSGSSAAMSAWTNAGFTGANLNWPAGVPSSFSVVSQSVAAGQRIACAQAVEVQPAMCTVPNVVGKVFNTSGTGTANNDWRTRQFTSSLSAPAFTANSFTVASQSLTANSSMVCGSPMTVEPAMCTVPNMASQLYNDVKDNGEAFKVAGFTSTLQRAWGDTSNRRIGYSVPAAGERVACGGYNVTAYEATCTVPNLSNGSFTFTNAKTAWQNATNGFTSSLTARGNNDPRNSDIVRSQQYAPGTIQTCSTPMWVSKNP